MGKNSGYRTVSSGFFCFLDFLTKPTPMKRKTGRRTFIRNIGLGSLGAVALPGTSLATEKAGVAPASKPQASPRRTARQYNDYYTDTQLSRIAFPIGGMGPGMLCLYRKTV